MNCRLLAARITNAADSDLATRRELHRMRGEQLLGDALKSLTGRRPALSRSPRGYLIGPPGHCLSLSHSEDIVLAAAAQGPDLLGVGVDVEHGRIPEDAMRVILTRDDDPGRGFTGSPAQWHRLVFSAKECVFKAQDPRLQTDLEFDEVAIESRGGFRWSARALSARAEKMLAEGPITGNACFDGARMWCVGLWTQESSA